MVPDADAGQDEDSGASDAAIADAGSPIYTCEHVEVVGTASADTPNQTSTSAPGDFRVSRQALRWECNPDRITIELSDGNCPHGAGHELTIQLSIPGIQNGQIRLGNNTVSAAADATGIAVSYTRPPRLTPHGTWGNCATTDGLLIFFEAPEVRVNAVLSASYMLPLPACDDSGNAPFSVSGTFQVKLRHNPSEACAGEMP